MRIDRLHLLRYGAFSDREIALRPDAAIHVVHGANEAGKSTALSALSDLLFGFGHAKSQDFLHDASTLRLAATLRAGGGDTIAFRRRRGSKNTLLADTEADEPLREDALAPYLGAVTRPIFERAFGLDSGRLRAGSAEMLASGGEMGTMLFAASSGILGLAATRRAMEAEAERIFTPRKSAQRTFYQALDRHESARTAERSQELRASDWKRLNEEIERLEADHAEKTRARSTLRLRQAELATLARLRPILAEIDEEAAALAGYGDIETLPDDMGVRLASALEAEREAEAGLRRAAEASGKARGNLERIALQPALAERMEAVAELFEARGAVRSYMSDLPRVSAERDQFADELGALAQRLGLDGAAFERAQPSDPEIAGVEDSLEGLRAAEARIEDLDRRIGEDEAELRRLEQERPQANLVDPEPFRARLNALKPDLDRLAALEAARGELAGRRRRLAEKAGRLDPSVDDLARIASAPLPTRAETARARDAMNEAEGRVRVTGDRLQAARQEMAALDEAMAADAAGALATRPAVEAARAARDAAIAEIGAVETEAFAAWRERGPARIRALVEAADSLADIALQDAERLARLAAGSARRAALAASVRTIEEELAAAEGTLSALRSDHEASFARAGVAALDPGRMGDWLTAVAALLETREEIETEAQRLDAVAGLEEAVAPSLRAIAEGAGVDGHASLPVPALCRAVEARLEALQRLWDESRTNTIGRQQCEDRLKRLQAERIEAVAARDAARRHLAEKIAPLGLPPEAGVSGIAAAVAAWKEAPRIRAEHENRGRRVRGMEREIAAFEEKVGALIAELQPDLARFAPTEAIGVLNDRARAAKAAAARAGEAKAELDEAERGEAEAARIRDAARAALLIALGDDGDIDGAPALAERLAARDEISRRLAAGRMRLRQIAPEMDEEEVRTRLGGFDPLEAVAESERLKAEEASLDAEVNDLHARLSVRRSERTALGETNGAETAAFERRAAEADMIEVAREWCVLKLSSALLGAAIERQRRANADPLLARAGESFRTLTRGAFERLSKRFGEDDTPELVALRASGEEIGLAAMSDGTVDQLHLALRIAYLEDYAARNEPMPFIADDVFQTFDDARTKAALEALGASSGAFQPIVFTHHESVAEAARQVHGEKADIVAL